MRIPGKRIKRTRLIQTEKYVVAVEVEMVILVDDPSEPCYESETIQLLKAKSTQPSRPREGTSRAAPVARRMPARGDDRERFRR
jgi:hypothetical protein